MYYGGRFLGTGLYKNGMRDSTWTYYRGLELKKDSGKLVKIPARRLKKYDVNIRISYRSGLPDGFAYEYNMAGKPWTAFQMIQDSLIGTGYEYDNADLVKREWKYDSLRNGCPYLIDYTRARTEGSYKSNLAFQKKNYSVYGFYSDTTEGFPVWNMKLKKIENSPRYSGEGFKDFSENDPPLGAEGDHRQYKDGALWEFYVVFHGVRKYSIRKGLPVKK